MNKLLIYRSQQPWSHFLSMKPQSNRMDERKDPHFSCIQETEQNIKYRCHLRVKGWKMVFRENKSKTQICVAILISDKIDFQQKIN